MPGRGAAGAPGVAGLLSFATMSGRGGTTGRAVGCPARFGFAGGRRGLPPPTGCAIAGNTVAAGAGGRGAGRGGIGMLATAAGRGAPGEAACGVRGNAGAFPRSPRPAGSGWRGPERICPGLGAGTGLAGMAEPRVSTAGAGAIAGPPADGPASGGRKGCDGRFGSERSPWASLNASLGVVGFGGSGSVPAAGC